MKTEEGIVVTLPHAKERLWLSGAGRDRKDPPLEVSGECGPANTLILAF